MMLQITRMTHFFMVFHMKLKKHSTTMLQMTIIIALFHGISMKVTQAAQYHDAKNDMRYCHFFMVFRMKFTKAVQYLNATNDMPCLMFSWYSL